MAKPDNKKPEGDAVYRYDETFQQLQSEAWEKQKPAPKHFQHAKISALAAMKMLRHALVGVEEGKKSESKTTFEVLGFLLGKVENDTYYIFDTLPSSAKGFENSVELAGNAMMQILDQRDLLEKKGRKDKIIGWYHSHPFDVETYSHCHLSGTDVRTQKNQQLMIPHFLAIVVDPLRSLARQEPDFGAFRCYPHGFKRAHEDECPDGTLMPKELRIKHWGHANDDYYALKVSYFMSGLAGANLAVLSKNNLWVRVFGSTPILEPESRTQFNDRVKKTTEKLDRTAAQLMGAGGRAGGFYAAAGPAKRGPAQDSELGQGATAVSEISIEQVKGHATQVAKHVLFNTVQKAQSKEEKKDEKKSGK